MATKFFCCTDWLASFHCGKYIEIFQSNNCTSKEEVSSLTTEKLRQWGIDTGKYSTGELILSAVRRLQQQSEEEAVQEYLVSNAYTR